MPDCNQLGERPDEEGGNKGVIAGRKSIAAIGLYCSEYSRQIIGGQLAVAALA